MFGRGLIHDEPITDDHDVAPLQLLPDDDVATLPEREVDVDDVEVEWMKKNKEMEEKKRKEEEKEKIEAEAKERAMEKLQEVCCSFFTSEFAINGVLLNSSDLNCLRQNKQQQTTILA